jgi:carbamoyl-phosphate synthase large subunit
MAKRTDLKSILILGAGPIVIGQACEFDYSGAQACKALREEGYRVILVNSNPATIMTDPDMADATYIEPIHWEVVRKIIEKERPCAVPTMGGQTALNCALELEAKGVLKEFNEICTRGLDLSPTSELLIDESLIGWKEYEMEVVRDKNDNCIIICSIENFDPMGIHTGDSITVAPAQTLTDKEYQIMRNASLAVLREIGVETGGSNVQFGVCPDTGRMVIIEMNPRVSRSSALASKATGFPIAKIAAKLAVGYTLDELTNDITGGKTPASFEPTIDYVVTKIPRFNFEKFAGCEDRLTTQMKSVGEVMAIGRNQQESMQKALRGLEVGVNGFDSMVDVTQPGAKTKIMHELQEAGSDRIWYIADAFRLGLTVDDIFRLTKIDRWFLVQIEDIVLEEAKVAEGGLKILNADYLRKLKRKGFADARLADVIGVSEAEIRKKRHNANIYPVYKRVDTCAAEFSSDTAYMYSTYDEECEANPTDKESIMILGGGPNRIGQGIEFDYCCVHAALALREDGYETIMVNCNPETVSTDYDTSDRLYFESITFEDVLEIVRIEKPKGVIVQYGGQTPLKLARALEAAGVPIIGTSPDAIDRAEDRERFQQAVDRLGLLQPENATVTSIDEAMAKAEAIGFPLVVRPSYVLGGRAMEIVFKEEELKRYMNEAVQVSNEAPVLLDSFLNNAIEVDIDAVCDGKEVVIGAIMQHIEQAGVHSGDSACAFPPYDLAADVQDQMRDQVKKMALELGVIGLMNTQLAYQDGEIYVIEVNPRASRTVPFVSKCIGHSLASIATRVMLGQSLQEIGFTKEIIPRLMHVKEAVFPFNKFQGVDPVLSPEMKSTGEVMGTGETFGEAFMKATIGAGDAMPEAGKAFISVRDMDKAGALGVAKSLLEKGFTLCATEGTAAMLGEHGLDVERVNKVMEGRPNIVDMIKNDEISYVVNTTQGRQSTSDSAEIRRSSLQHKVPYTTTVAGAQAIVMALTYGEEQVVRRLQDIH